MSISNFLNLFDKNISSKYCRQFYTRFEVGKTGLCWMCCPSWLPNVIGNLNDQTVKEIWNGDAAQKLRNQMFDNEWLDCKRDKCPMIISDSLPEKTDMLNAVPNEYNPHPISRMVYDWEIEAVKNKNLISYPYPVSILFGTDESCNLQCPSCRTSKIQFIEGPEYEKRKFLTDKLVKELLEIDPSIKLEFWITGSGDPFGSKIYREMLQNINGKAYPNLSINLQTNGNMFTPKMYKKISNIHDNLRNCQISFDAGTKDTYENKTRIGGNWDLLLKNCDFLNTVANDNKLFHLSFDFVIQTKNYKEIIPFIELTKSRYPNVIGVDFSLISNWSTWPIKEFEQQCVWKPEHPEYNELLKILRDPIFYDDLVHLGNAQYLREKLT